MFSVKTTLALGFGAATALALPSPMMPRAGAAITHATCPNATYTNHAIQAATKAGAQLAAEGTFVGPAFGTHYPQPWFNVDDLAITVPGTYSMFPILASGVVWDANEPAGTDFVLFNSVPEVAAVIYETPPGDTQAGWALCGN